MFEYVKKHVLDNCRQLHNTSLERKAELGGIVFEKIYKKLRKDIELYSSNL